MLEKKHIVYYEYTCRPNIYKSCIAWFIIIQKVEFKSKIFFPFIHHKKKKQQQTNKTTQKQKINKNLKINKAPHLIVHFCLMS